MRVLRQLACLLLVPLAMASAGGDEGVALPGAAPGDVLHPGRASGLVWHLGFDAGITYSMFRNGPISYISPNPLWTISPSLPFTQYPLEATVNDGSGLGFVVAGAVDLSFSKSVGVVLKLNYHTRTGAFDNTTDTRELHPGTLTGLTTVLHDKVDWTFQYFGVDLLARIQLMEDKLYLLVGPSYSKLLKNKAKLTQNIAQPNDIFYVEEAFPTNPTQNQIRSVSNEFEVTGFDDSRFDLKAGLGWWIPIGENLFLTPEVTVAIPLAKMASKVGGTSRFSAPFTANNASWNMTTIFATLGLRWRLH